MDDLKECSMGTKLKDVKLHRSQALGGSQYIPSCAANPKEAVIDETIIYNKRYDWLRVNG